MLLDENYDADEILKEPGDDEEELFDDDEIVPELDFGRGRSLSDLDLPPEEEEDLFS